MTDGHPSAIEVPGLTQIDGFGFPLYAGPGANVRARFLGARARQALDWLTAVLGPEPSPVSFVIGPEQWPMIAEVPIYGLPHVNRADEGLLDDLHWKMVMGDEPGEFWGEVYDFIWPHLTEEDRASLRLVYVDESGFAARFPDLIVVHELAHVYQDFYGGSQPDRFGWHGGFPRQWVGELFANIAMYGYLAEVEPGELPTLEAICKVADRVPTRSTPVRALDDMYRSFEYANGAVLYCWYQFLVIMGAKRIWQRVGREGLRSFYQKLSRPQMTDDEILRALARIDDEALRFVRDWPGTE